MISILQTPVNGNKHVPIRAEIETDNLISLLIPKSLTDYLIYHSALVTGFHYPFVQRLRFIEQMTPVV